MRYILAIILFPIHWFILFIVRVIYYDIIWGFIYLFVNLIYGFWSFLSYLIFLPFWIIFDTVIAIIFTCSDSYHMSKSIITKDKPLSYYYRMQDHSLHAKRESYTNENGNYTIKRTRDKKEHYTNEKAD